MSTVIDGSAGITTNAGGSVNPSTNIDGINYSCRAWVNFNGTGTIAIRASGNVTSITDNGTGDYTVNFTNAMSDANYSANATSITRGGASTPGINITIGYGSSATSNATSTYSTTAVRFYCQSSTAPAVDSDTVSVVIFR